MEFGLLGDVEVRVGGRVVDVGHSRQRCVLVALLVEANRLVPVDVLVDRVWGEQVPHRARNAVAGYVSRLRQVLPDEVSIVGRQGGYVLTVDPMTVDLHRFTGLLERARVTPDVGLLNDALGLWRGEPFSTLDTPWLVTVRSALEARRLAALLDRNDLALEQGRHTELLAELDATAAAFPLDERLAGQLMLALYRCGRQADALLRYEQVRLWLADELGADPGPELRLLHKKILTGDLALPAGQVTPRQLPAPPRSFAGRARELAALDAVSTGPVVVSGMGGVGKTALAVHWAHRVAARFSDGQLYLNLRGFGPDDAMTTGEALRALLGALGLRVPDSTDAQASRYRSALADKRMLIVLDNARDADQVRSLLPGSPGCLVLVTSRTRLTGLVAADGAHPVALDLLSAQESRELLAGRLRAVPADSAATTEIITRCAGLPLALTVVAARAACTGFPLRAIAAELRRGLDPFDGGDSATDVRAVFSWSYRALGSAAARLFRLLGLHPGPDVCASAAAGLLGTPQVGPLLAELTRAHLLVEHQPGRYLLHDLLRAYAVELAQLHDSVADRRLATRRVLDHYVRTSLAAARSQALAWFTTEQRVLLAAAEHAAATGFDTHAWQLARTLAEFLERRGHWSDLADPRAQSHAHRVLTRASTQLDHPGVSAVRARLRPMWTHSLSAATTGHCS
ncbi:AfsR/SARP family transcriptional regulator [Lentzea kentuckyensis]|uniref:AfsR/SARP family transcriptional regulator n=1 Tax=Lentzea kentuckyensis TaxID=360086 RepID=UPI001302CC52|nr:AfsR/SARP family transcriptional regulator [Lentzea kentuckyensis]